MAGENDQEKGEDASSPEPTSQDEGATHEGSGERPHVDEDAIIREGIEARRRLGRQVAQEALADPDGLTPERLRRLGPEGLQRFVVELRRAGLDVEPAQRRRESTTPSVPGASKPSVRQPRSTSPTAPELRGKAAPPSDRGRTPGPTAGTGRSGAGDQTPQPVPHPPGSIDATSSEGWWGADLHQGLLFELWAGILGLLVGALAILASLVWLARTHV